ncbi:autotransporter domain-containing protein [Xanthobacter sp. 126]|uniref:autotransporter domain-containing protein n=1 Tax=Xanthobacter sp. 126 TaxID=1131814 RepID=UPI00045E75C9|nr:autotransporter domain-containing protein [Xanthobacter sp. 126]
MVVGVSGAGGAGITGYGYDLTNTGSVIGGIGGQGGSMFIGPKSNEPGAGGAGAQGGVGAGGSNFTIHNTGVIGGGAGGAGGAGSDSQFAPVVPVGETVSQHFTVPGSYATLAGKGEPGDDGGNGGAGGLGGLGGAGISGTSFTAINETTLYGGAGGLGGDGGRGGAGGTGGPGISLDSTISVPGVVLSSTAGTGGTGGAGGNGGEGGTGGAGGVGVTGTLFDLTNRGTLTGGAGAKGGTGGAAGVGGQGGVGGNVRVDVGPAVGDAAGRGVSGRGGDGNVGGAGGAGGTGGAGGAGVSGSSFIVTNAGSIAGGAGAEGGTGGEGGAGGSGGSAGSFHPGGSGDFENSVNVSGAAKGGGNGGRGGDGGAGGDGVTGTAFSITSSGTISGGKGGDGGAGGSGGSGAIPAKGGTGGSGGNGGNGGVGVSGSSFTLTNTGTIIGGDGGMAGLGGLGGARVEGGGSGFAPAGDPGVDGVGGLGAVGVISTGGSTIKNAGSIVGGLSGDGVTRANAVELSGGGNTLELQAGYSFTGNVLSTSGTTNGGDALKLGGTDAAAFDVGHVVPTLSGSLSGTQYVGFNALSVVGGEWTGTGTNASGLSWTLTGGVLAIADAKTLEGAGPSFLTTTFDGGTLRTTASLTLSGDLVLLANGGTLETAGGTTATLDGALSGSGAFTKTGDGTATLTNANAGFTGRTVVDAGTLALSGAGSISSSSAVAVNATFDISGIDGTGTTIETLSGSADGAIALGTKVLTVNQGADATFAGVISGSGGFTKEGVSTLTLTGANAGFTGQTVVDAGTLALAGAGSISSSSAVAVNATFDISGIEGAGTTIKTLSGSADGAIALGTKVLTVNQGADATFAGVISGSGGFTKEGVSTLTLTSANAGFTGRTVVDAGTLALSGAGSISNTTAVAVNATFDISGIEGAGTTIKTLSGSADGAIALGTKVLTVNQGADATFAGVISGSGGFTKEGASTLTLTGANTYGGGTTISAGTLQVGDGGTSGSLSGDVLNNAALVFDRSDVYGFSWGLSGSGTMTFRGGGTVQLGSSGTFSGGTFVEDGTVTLANAALGASVFTVQTGGVLAGQGTIGGLVVNSGGVAAPGNSPGTLTVKGDVAFNSGSVYRVDVTAGGAHDLIDATGAVALSSGASVAVNAGGAAFLPGTAYAIITTSGTVTGTFGSLTGDLPTSTYIFLDPGLSYDTHNVYLGLVYNDIAFTTFARTPNEAGAASAAQHLGDGNPIYDAILALPKGATPGAAFAALSGEAYASASTVIVQQSSYVRDAVGARMIQALPPEGAPPLGYATPVKAPATAHLGAGLTPTLWALGYGGWGDTNGDTNAAAVSNTIAGFLIGADAAVSDHARAGVFGGYGRSSFNVADRASSGSIDTYDMGLYGAAQFGHFAARGALAYGWHDVSMDRTVGFPGFYEALSGGYSSGSFQAFGELAYGLTFGAFDVEPFAGLAYLNLDGASLTETGGAAALGVSTASFETTYSTLGVRLATSIGVFGRPLTPSVTLAWQHAFGDTTPYASMLFAGGTTPFQVAGAPIVEDALLVGAGLGYAASELATLSVKYNGQIASGASQNAFSAEFAWKF